MKVLKTFLYKPLGYEQLGNDRSKRKPTPEEPQTGYLFDSDGFALCDSEGFLLDTID